MTGHEIVMLALIVAFPTVLGFFGGMLWMRWQYIERMRRDHRMMQRMLRRI